MDEEDQQQQFQDDMNGADDMAGEDEMDMAGDGMEPGMEEGMEPGMEEGMEPGMEEGVYEEGSPDVQQEDGGSPTMVAEEGDVTGRRLDGAEESAVIGGAE